MLNRLVVIGAGAVGGSIGGLLADSGFPVIMVARGDHGKKIRELGLRVRMPERTIHVYPDCVERVDQVNWQEGDVSMVATKLQDAESVMDGLVTCAGRQMPVVCATNGVHAERWACARFETVLSTLIWMPAVHLVAGEVQLHSGACHAVLDTGPASESDSPAATLLSEQFCLWLRAADFDAVFRADINLWKHAKWVTNLGNAAQALVIDDWQSVAVVAKAEGETVLTIANVPRIPTQQLLDRVAHIENNPIGGQDRTGGSTWQSFHRGKPLETPWIEGAIADLADEVGVRAPVNRNLSDASQSPRPLLASEVLG